MKRFFTRSLIASVIISTMCLASAFGITSKNNIDVHDNPDNYINISGGDIYQCSVQRDLLKDAMNYVGVGSPEKAVEVWSEGLKQRSAAIQYSVMTKELRDIYENDLKQTYPNWVTGISSPWVEGYEIVNEKKVNDKTHCFEVRYDTATSTGPATPFTVILVVINNNDFWRISKVNGDAISTVYTGFQFRDK